MRPSGRRPSPFAPGERTPPADVLDNGREYVVILDVPGADQGGVEVRPGPVPGTVSIRAEAKPIQKGTPVRTERGASTTEVRYQRIVPVGWDADVHHAEAKVKDGVLTVTVPRSQPGSEQQSQKK